MITLESGDLSVDVDPAHGLDLPAGRFGGTLFSADPPHGLMFTCGLSNVGLASEGQPKHGHYRDLPAEDVEHEGSKVRGRVLDGVLELTRELVVTSGAIAVRDVVRNTGDQPEPAPLLYHVNFRWDSVATDATEVVPRDADARAADWREVGTGPERVYEHLGASGADVTLGTIRIRVESDLPRLWQWIDPSRNGVLGIEPANCSVLGRAHDRAEGRLPVLAPGEARASALRVTVVTA